MRQFSIDKMVGQYLETAIWADLRDDDGGFQESFDYCDFAPSTIEEAKAICLGFYNSNKQDIESFCELLGFDEEQIGHDLWLTSQGHGAGFWDRASSYSQPEAYEIGERLTEASKLFANNYLYIGDDGKVYIE